MHKAINRTTVILAGWLLCHALASARESTDVVVMNNGDRLTGEIKGLDSGALYLSLDYVDGTISVAWSKVARIESKQLFIVTASDGSVYSGTVGIAEAEGERPAKLELIETADQKVELDPAQVVQMAGTSESIWQRFNGAFSLGLSYTKASSAAQYNLGSSTEYLRERWSAQVVFNSVLSTSTGSAATTHNQLTFSAIHLLPWKNYFYIGLMDFLQNSDQGIQLQSSLGGGVGRYLKNTRRFNFAVIGGMAFQSTSYAKSLDNPADNATRQNLGGGLLGARLKLFHYKKTDLQVVGIFFPAISEPGRMRFNANMSYYLKLFSNLAWTFSFYGNWDNRPPNQFSTSDYGSSSGVSWTYGLK